MTGWVVSQYVTANSEDTGMGGTSSWIIVHTKPSDRQIELLKTIDVAQQPRSSLIATEVSSV